MTAAVGVILDQASNTQKFFGGGQVDTRAKNVSNDNDHHTDDITAITISSDRCFAASGQVGSAPAAFLWDAATGQKQQRFKLTKGARGVDAIAISNDGTLVALVDRHDQHNVYVFDVASGAGSSKPGDTNRIFDICFSNRPGDNSFVTAGSKHIKFWDPSTLEGKKGIFGEGGEATSFACVATDDQGNAFTGGANSMIYVWQERNCKQAF
jgi:WD40 repeat protein